MSGKKKLLSLIATSALCALSLVFSFGFLSSKAETTPVAEFKIENGAAVRLATTEEINQGAPVNGVRFSSYITETYYNALQANYPNASNITLQSTVSKVVEDSATAPAPFVYEWDITKSSDIKFDDEGIATFYHTINFKSLSDDELKMANAFEFQGDFWLEVTPNSATEATVIQADNAGEVDVTRAMRQVAYLAYVTPSTAEKPNPNYQDKRLLNYFSHGESDEAVYDMDVKTTALSAIAPENVTAEKAYVMDGDGIADVTGKTLADVFSEEEASVSTTKQLLFFDADNTAHTVQTRFVTKIINTETEATNFFNTTANATSETALTGYYLQTEDLNVTANYKYNRYFKDGTFDGDGHTLTVAMGANHIVGLFGRISNVTIKNIQLNIVKDFSNSTSSRAQKDSILGYKDGNASFVENVHLNLNRADGDTDANYSSSAGYPQLYLIGNSSVATAENLVVNIADDTFIFSDTTVKSINPIGFATTENCYIFSDQSELIDVSTNASLWRIYPSIATAIEKSVTFKALTDSNYWTVDTENKTLTFGKVIVVPEEPEDETTDTPDVPTEGEFNPVVRFAVTSDVHIRRYNVMGGVEQLETVYDTAYNFAGDEALNDGYDKLDGVFVVGDLGNYEVDYEYPLFFNVVNSKTQEGTLSRSVMGNHEFSQLVYSGNGNSWSNTDTITTATNKFLAASGYESEDYHTVINGYHFIFVSMDRYGKSSGTQYEYISSTKLDWIKQELDIAVADDATGEKPIFVFQHVHPKDTVGSSTNGDGYLKTLLDEYPNVVDFSGHTHKPITDPRSVWQDTFTAINTGSLAYLSQNIRESGYGAKAVNDKGEWAIDLEAENTARDGGLYYICEVNADNVMRVFVYDTFTDSVFGEPIYIDSFGDPAGFDYTADREEMSVSPVFDTTDEITVTKNLFNRTDITFPQATGDDLVENYRIEIYQDGQLVKTEYRLSGVVYGNAMPKNMQVTIAGLSPATTYTLKVYAINYWLKVSDPLVKEFTTAAAAEDVTPDIAAITFNETGGVDALGGSVVKKGSSGVVYDETLEKYVGAFNADGAYAALNLADWYSTLKCGFTIEAYVKVTDTPAKKYALLGNNDDGSFALYYTSAGNYNFICEFGETEYSVSYAGAVGEWTHVVGVYDGSALKLYINGELVATTSVAETYRPPRLLSNYLLIGADPYYVNDGYEYPCKASIATANLYGYALTEEQVQAIYQKYQSS